MLTVRIIQRVRSVASSNGTPRVVSKGWCEQRQPHQQQSSSSSPLWFHTTSLAQEDSSAPAAAKVDEEAALRKLAARDFNNRRAAYKREVSVLRKKYAAEVARQRAADQAEREALERELTRKRLERQRRKNIRSAQNAIRQKQLRDQRAKEFEEHLKLMQLRRDAKNELYARARQLVVDELEEEAPLWLATPEEVEAAFTPEAEQLLWARPGGVLGAPNPSLDSHFWQYETHTWRMERTFKSQRQVLLEQLEEMAYEEANVDAEFWTEERLNEQLELEEKARLRAMVQSAGRIELLNMQKRMLEEEFSTKEGELPKSMPAPNLKMLENEQALEREGAKLLNEDPTKFFVFDSTSKFEGGDQVEQDESGATDEESTAYAGPALGSPVGLRDPLREGSHQNSVFPQIVGRIPKPDTRTEREKKQQEREERMWAAAQEEAKSGDKAIDMAAQDVDEDDLEPDINYDDLRWEKEDEEAWKKGLDPVADADIINLPRELRYSEEDIEWVVAELGSKINYLQQELAQDMQNVKQKFESEARRETGQDQPFEDGSIEAALMSLSDEDLFKLSDLDDRYAAGMSEEEFLEAAKQFSGISVDQLRKLLDRERE